MLWGIVVASFVPGLILTMRTILLIPAPIDSSAL